MNTAGRHLIGLELKVSVLHPEVEQRRVAFFDALLQQRNLLQQLQQTCAYMQAVRENYSRHNQRRRRGRTNVVW